jgi:DNA end-binding protein Ku
MGLQVSVAVVLRPTVPLGVSSEDAVPPRALASATISFGLVSIPVKLYPAGESADRFAFHWLHAKCGTRLRIQYFCPKDDEVVPRKEMVKGYEVSKGRYVTFTARELEALEQVSTQTIEIEEFLPAEAIDPVYFVKAYYLGPDKAGAKGYRLLAQVLRKAGRVALGRYAARGKQYLVLLRASGEVLVMHELHHREELRKPVEVPRGEASVKPSELRLAERLVEQAEGETFHPERYPDEVRDRVRALIRKKAAGKEVSVSPPESRKGRVIDLMEALKASLARKSGTEKTSARPARRSPSHARTRRRASR